MEDPSMQDLSIESVRGHRRDRGQLSALAGIAIAAVAFVAGLAGGFAGGFTFAGTNAAKPAAIDRPMPGEFFLAPGNQMPPGIVVPLD
jgi:hypothetical protein